MQQPEIYECPTCGKKYTTQRNCNKHRALDIRFKQQWGKGKQEQYKCTFPKRKENILTSKQQLNRIHHHTMQPANNPLYTLGPEGHIGRREMIYNNAPTGEIAQANGATKYRPKQKQMRISKMRKKGKRPNKRCLIQHVIAKHEAQKPHTTRIPALTPQEHKPVQIRIETLQIKEAPEQDILCEIVTNPEP